MICMFCMVHICKMDYFLRNSYDHYCVKGWSFSFISLVRVKDESETGLTSLNLEEQI